MDEELGVERDEARSVDRLCEVVQLSEDWRERADAIVSLAELVPDARAERAIADATHDSVDWVAFTALRVAGEHRLTSAVADIIKICGWPSNFMQPHALRKPVGCGAAFAKRALVEILGSADPVELRELEDRLFAGTQKSVNDRRRGSRQVDRDVVLVRGGLVLLGGGPLEADPYGMDTRDSPVGSVHVESFYIDRVAVTNERYARFLEATADDTSFDHPDQDARTRRPPAHWGDPRFSDPAFPVVGIDWYDAWAFAHWAGGDLPSEQQWEKAARGTDARLFPWGNDFDGDLCHFIGSTFGVSPRDVGEMDALLATATRSDHPARPLLPADELQNGASPFGAVQMAGNVWEMTRTNYFTRLDMDPFFRGRKPVEFSHRRDAFFVLKGGAWTSPPTCLLTFYRGRDLLTDRHCEIGFRCVYDAPVEVLDHEGV